MIFVLDEMRKKSVEEVKTTTIWEKNTKKSKNHGLEWGVLFGFKSGLTMETIVLRSIPIDTPCVSSHDNAKSLCSCEKTYG